MNTRIREEIISQDAESYTVKQIVEEEQLWVCPNCPGSPGMVAIDDFKAGALSALYHRAKSQGLGMFALSPRYLDAPSLLKETQRFDYLHGRVLKVDLSGDEFDPRLYDRDNGVGAAEHAVTSARMGREYEHVSRHWIAQGAEVVMQCPRCGR